MVAVFSGGGRGRVSGLQKEVLGLYRAVLRAARTKDKAAEEVLRLHGAGLRAARANDQATGGAGAVSRGAEAKDGQRDAAGDATRGTEAFAKRQFRSEAASVKRSEFQQIEFLVRKGHKQLRLLSMPGVERAFGVEAHHPHHS